MQKTIKKTMKQKKIHEGGGGGIEGSQAHILDSVGRECEHFQG